LPTNWPEAWTLDISSEQPRKLQQKKEIALIRIVIFPDEDNTPTDWA
jgi:hypothetical protein